METEPGTARDSRVANLLSALAGAKRIVVLPHINPDPDSLACAAALRALIGYRLKRHPLIGFGGMIGRSENRAMVSALEISLVPVENLISDRKAAFILVDSQPGRANTPLPKHITPTAVIDHHPDWGNNGAVPFVDLRENYGATSTILTEYLEEAEVPTDARVATGLFYGIASETQQLGRETKPADIIASQFLYPYVNKRLLGEIQYPPLSRDYFQLIGEAVHNTVLYGDIAVTVLAAVPYPDAVAELADFVLRLQEIRWSACLALHKSSLYVSLRSRDPKATAGLLLASLLPSGMAGGHGMIAGGRYNITRRRWKQEACQIVEGLLKALGRPGGGATLLVEDQGARSTRSELQSLLLRLGQKGASARKATRQAT